MAKIVDQQYIIAIGASAGGLEAISVFLTTPRWTPYPIS